MDEIIIDIIMLARNKSYHGKLIEKKNIKKKKKRSVKEWDEFFFLKNSLFCHYQSMVT